MLMEVARLEGVFISVGGQLGASLVTRCLVVQVSLQSAVIVRAFINLRAGVQILEDMIVREKLQS